MTKSPMKARNSYLQSFFLCVLFLGCLLFDIITAEETQRQGNQDSSNSSRADSLSPDTSKIPVTKRWDKDLTLTSFVHSDSLPLNDTLRFTVQVELVGNPDHYDFQAVPPPQASNLKLIGSSSSNKTVSSDEGMKMLKQYQFMYAPSSRGMAYINPLTLNYTFTPLGRERSLHTSRLSVAVTEPVERSSKGGVTTVAVVIVLALISAAVAVYLIKFKGEEAEEQDAESISIEEEYLRELESLKGLITKGAFSKAINRITLLLKEYLFKKYELDEKGLSTQEIIERLVDKEVKDNTLERVESILEVSENVRFAKYDPSKREVNDSFSNFQLLLESNLKDKDGENNG